jgi:hypothetical protein
LVAFTILIDFFKKWSDLSQISFCFYIRLIDTFQFKVSYYKKDNRTFHFLHSHSSNIYSLIFHIVLEFKCKRQKNNKASRIGYPCKNYDAKKLLLSTLTSNAHPTDSPTLFWKNNSLLCILQYCIIILYSVRCWG